jgi:uncharacterized protein
MSLNRRAFLKRAAVAGGVTAGLGTAGWVYGRFEATWLHVVELTVAVPRLPAPFAGLRIALVTDTHHGPYNSLEYIASAVDTTNALGADLIAVGGDLTHGPHGSKFLAPCMTELGRLTAPLGVYGVPGNHDHYDGVQLARKAMTAAGITDVTNGGTWLERDGYRLRIAGVDDLLCGRPRPDLAVGDAGPGECCLLLSHNPEVAELLTDPRIGLVLSGHMHGGQVVIPGIGYHCLPSQFGDKYVEGLVNGPVVPVFVSRGVGVIGLPIRFRCRPEVNLLTLVPA